MLDERDEQVKDRKLQIQILAHVYVDFRASASYIVEDFSGL
jgi:hypothetical protein